MNSATALLVAVGASETDTRRLWENRTVQTTADALEEKKVTECFVQ